MTITADTITDEQIRELLTEALAHAYPGSSYRDDWDAAHDALVPPPGIAREVSDFICLRDDSPDNTPERRAAARARCAEILNARRRGQ